MSEKQFVKAKPLLGKQKPAFQRQSRKNNKKYEQKAFQQPKDPRDHIKFILNQFKLYQRNKHVLDLCSRFPKLFTEKSCKPQPQTQVNLNDFLWYGNKRQVNIKVTKQLSSDSSQPDWDSDQDKQVKLVSKVIDNSIIQRVNTQISKHPPKRLEDLQRHEKQFLQQYYRQKRQAQHQPQNAFMSEDEDKKEQKQNKNVQSKQKTEKQEEEWAEYDPNVGALITGGFIQKVEKGQQQEDFQQMDEDFSYESEKSKKQSSSSEEDDDMFADQGPRTVVKTKEDRHNENEKKQIKNKQFVNINNHAFTQIAEQLGMHPETCTWIISNKLSRYRVSTQYMNEYYKSSYGLNAAFPYVSLNNSQFVHSDQLQTQRGLERLKRSNARRNKNQKNFSNNNRQQRPQAPHYKQKK